MSSELEQKARELLAAEYEKLGGDYTNIADYLRRGEPPIEHHVYVVAIRAITRALQSRPADALEEALEPFAKLANEFDDQTDEQWVSDVTVPVTIGDCRRARAAISAPQASTRSDALGWQPIETAPKDGTRILGATYCPDLEAATGWRIAVMFWDNEFEADGWNDDETTYRAAWNAWRVGSWGYEQYYEETPSRWRPLPPPPADHIPSEEQG